MIQTFSDILNGVTICLSWFKRWILYTHDIILSLFLITSCSPTAGPGGPTESYSQNTNTWGSLLPYKTARMWYVWPPSPSLCFHWTICKPNPTDSHPYLIFNNTIPRFHNSCILLTMMAGEGRGVFSLEQRKTESSRWPATHLFYLPSSSNTCLFFHGTSIGLQLTT